MCKIAELPVKCTKITARNRKGPMLIFTVCPMAILCVGRFAEKDNPHMLGRYASFILFFLIV